MTDRPLLFRSAMVVALNEDRKTQTRRPASSLRLGGERVATGAMRIKVGDWVWVRENWRVGASYDDRPPREVPRFATVWFEATGEPSAVLGTPVWYAGKLRPSLFMPRWASRLTLIVTGVKIERLQDISEADAIAEGVQRDGEAWKDYSAPRGDRWVRERARESYGSLYVSIHGKGAWNANPEVVAITFTVHKHNIDALKQNLFGDWHEVAGQSPLLVSAPQE